MIGVGEIDDAARAHARREALRAHGLRRWRSAPRKAWRCSTARSSPPPRRWPRCSGRRPVAGALVTGALSTEAAKGSDAPFDPRIHALRRHTARSTAPTRCAR